MPDIRKMLEEQFKNLQDASMDPEAASDCTYAMLAIVDVLYPDGIPEAENNKIPVPDYESGHMHTCQNAPKAISEMISSKCCVDDPSTIIQIDGEILASMVSDRFGKKSKVAGRADGIEIRIED